MARIIDKYYIMNLETRQDRREECDMELRKANIENYEYFKSTHWKDVPPQVVDSYLAREYHHVTKDDHARRGLFGCGLTHVLCIERFIQEHGTDGTKTAVLLEDDFRIKEPLTFKTVINSAINLSKDWDMIYLGGLKNPKDDKRETYLPGLEIAISVWNAHAYVIRNTQDIYDKMKSYFERGFFADRALRKMIRDDKDNKNRYLIVDPYLVDQRRSYSDINEKIK
jgi:GR25 family glycosyltransferase involved in LPS biosynthesis